MPSWSAFVNYTIPAAASIANILAGTSIEYISEACTLTVYGTCDTAGDTWGLLGYRGAQPGESYVPTGSLVPPASTAGAIKTNENFLGQFAIPGGTRLVLPVAGTAAHVGRFQFVIS